MSLPAAALSKPDTSATSGQTTPGAVAKEQGLDVAVTVASAPLPERDGYAAEPKPAPVPVAPAYASGAYTGPVPDAFLGMFSVWPVAGGVLADGFGYRDGGEFHGGIDVIAPGGTPIVAVGAGTVVQIDGGGGWGQYVKIDHGGGVQTLYAHMIAGSPVVGVGQFVEAGQVIGLVGSTGYATTTHCHLEVYVEGGRVDPMQFFAL
ncbi:MAG: M23 family metallopeptidase [Microbacteriaceae bacterium]|nr:M23 family metallopeptidase [Microbacteriaceae bacterium]